MKDSALRETTAIVWTVLFVVLVSGVCGAEEVNCPQGTSAKSIKEGRRTIRYCELPNGTKHGPWIETWWDGRIEGAYRNGKKDGIWTESRKSGRKIEERTYRRGSCQRVLHFHGNGKPKMEIDYKKGKVHGEWVGWYESGPKRVEGSYRDGRRHGLWTYWHKNGKKEESGQFLKGKKQGRWTAWHENGKKLSEGSYTEGVRHGRWTFWYASGQKERSGKYQNGVEHGKWEKWARKKEATVKPKAISRPHRQRNLSWYWRGRWNDDSLGDPREPDMDTDEDGIPNSKDNCVTRHNADQKDMDGDGVGDNCDEDRDGDGFMYGDGTNPCTGGKRKNCQDNCPEFKNPEQKDVDADGVGDECDGCPWDYNPRPICNTYKDCLNAGAPGNCEYDRKTKKSGRCRRQPDRDHDGFPDACDLCPDDYNWKSDYKLPFKKGENLTWDACTDTDQDGITDYEERTTGRDGEITDPHKKDTDGDGIDDGEETSPGEDGYVTDPTDPDTDGDGIIDSEDR